VPGAADPVRRPAGARSGAARQRPARPQAVPGTGTTDAVPRQQLDTQVSLVHQLEGTVKNDQGQIEATKVQLVYCRITSPIAGRVGLRLVDQGNIVHATDTGGLVIITQLQPITVIFTIPEDSI